LIAVGLALAASACWGVADFVAGLNSRRLSALVVLLVQQAVGLPLVAAVILLSGEGPPSGRAIVLSLLAGAAGALALGAFYRALAVGTMSVVAPISASGVTLPVVVGIVTGDRPSALQAAGLVLTVAGVVLASREVHEGEPSPASRTSILLALVAGAGFGGFFTFSDVPADESILWLLLLGRSVAVTLIMGAGVMSGTLPGRLPAPLLPALAVVGVLDVTATALYALANTKGLLAVVAVVGSLYPVTTVLLARFVLGERLRAVQGAGVVLAFGGVAAVAGG
jgi:uncharacterized membrane protein